MPLGFDTPPQPLKGWYGPLFSDSIFVSRVYTHHVRSVSVSAAEEPPLLLHSLQKKMLRSNFFRRRAAEHRECIVTRVLLRSAFPSQVYARRKFALNGWKCWFSGCWSVHSMPARPGACDGDLQQSEPSAATTGRCAQCGLQRYASALGVTRDHTAGRERYRMTGGVQ